ncbi:DUF115 domain-containing protein, partial [bacterium]|nr:DUF115 domain-containing protein [bacterium]
MNILIIGARKPKNAMDLGYPAFETLGHIYVYLYDGIEYPLRGGIQVNKGDIINQLRSIISHYRINILYFRADWYDAIYKEAARQVFSANLGVPKVFGYHCHTACPNELEEFVFSRADAFVLLNEEALTYFSGTYGVSKPYFLMPSLLFPPRSWYDTFSKLPKLSACDGGSHCVIPSAVIRLSGLASERVPLVPIENFLCERYDYYQIVQNLAARQIHVHVYGKFVKFPLGYARDVEQVYRELEANSSYIHLEGVLPEKEFTVVLSQYDFAILLGFLPGYIVPKFDHMNYQGRLNSVLAAGLPIFVAKGTSADLEREISESGAGFVFDSFEDLKNEISNSDFMHSASKAAIDLQERDSFEAWMEPLCQFFQEVIETTDVQNWYPDVDSASVAEALPNNNSDKWVLKANSGLSISHLVVAGKCLAGPGMRLVRKYLWVVCDSHTIPWNCPKVGFFTHAWRNFRYRMAAKVLPFTKNERLLCSYKDCHKGGRAFIMGNGPSLNDCDLRTLKDEVTFGVNSIFLNYEKMGFYPTYYVVEDVFVAEDRANEINAYHGPVKFFGNYLRYCISDSYDNVWLNVRFRYDDYPCFPHFSRNAARMIWTGGTVSYICMQLAYYMGFSEVYLVGFDHSYTIPPEAQVAGTEIRSTSDDPNHFHPDYFGKGYRWHDPKLDRMEKA